MRVGGAIRRVRQAFAHRRREFRDRHYSTYADTFLVGPSFRHFSEVDVPASFLDIMRHLTDHYLAHRFDVLGSGRVEVRHGVRCRGLEGYRYQMGAPVQPDLEGRWLADRINPANVDEARRIWGLVDEEYTPIDWHLDFKSGYRWLERTWCLRVPYAPRPGVDIKVPWELARMHHLVQLAWAYAGATRGPRIGLAPAETYAREFRNQVLDFVATNPPRFGVNWRSPMDAAIRIVNCLVGYDLFRAYGAEFDSAFERVFRRSVYEHGQHILAHLEWDPVLRTNHYLANIAGLLFVAAYLPRSPETDAWLAFAVQELIGEVGYQFHPDGTCFEASTCYHRLSVEMVLYATALVLGLPAEKRAVLAVHVRRLHGAHPLLRPAPVPLHPLPNGGDFTPFPAWYLERLAKMTEFTLHITKPSGLVPQIGDNDSGRFIKLQPAYRRLTVAEAKARYANLAGYDDLPDDAAYWDEDVLNHRHLIGVALGLLDTDHNAGFADERGVENALIRNLARGKRLPSYRNRGDPAAAELIRVGTDEDWSRLRAQLDPLPDGQKDVVAFHIPGDGLRENLTLYAYPDFGLYVCRSHRVYLALRCGRIGQSGFGGHAHNDQLSLELNVDGEDWIVDPGTYLYTSLPALRQCYRSVHAHFAPRLSNGAEPGRLDLGLFRLGDEAKAQCLYFGERGFIGMHHGYGRPVYRVVELLAQELYIRDYSLGGALVRSAARAARRHGAASQFLPASPAYGVRYV